MNMFDNFVLLQGGRVFQILKIGVRLNVRASKSKSKSKGMVSLNDHRSIWRRNRIRVYRR